MATAAVGLSLNAVKSISSRTAVVSISAERPRAAGISDLSALGLLVRVANVVADHNDLLTQ